MFTPVCLERVRFLEFPVEELRGAKMAYCFPESEQEQMEEIVGRLVELEEPFVCDENEGDEKCNERFANYRQLMAHKTQKHGVRTVLGLLTRTNECPWCGSRFVDRETALHHVYNATETKGKATSISHGGTILSACLMTCSVDCVTIRPKILRNSNCKRDDECVESGQESDSRGRRKQRETASCPRVEARDQ